MGQEQRPSRIRLRTTHCSGRGSACGERRVEETTFAEHAFFGAELHSLHSRSGTLARMSMRTPGQDAAANSPLGLDFPQSLAVYDDYAGAQKTVDFLSDKKFPVEQCVIVGTDLKRIERITGRLTTGKVALGGLLSGVWLGLFVGLIIALFANENDPWPTILGTVLFGAVFGTVWALVGYAFTRGRRDFSSVASVVATKYEVLVSHKVAAQARDLLAELPGGLPDPFA